jgi:hypothetical protein
LSEFDFSDLDEHFGEHAAMRPYREAIAKREADERGYATVGIPIKHRGMVDRALGRYGIMMSNLPSWSEAALGRRVSPEEFIQSKELQDQVFNHQFGNLVRKYGPADAASVWLTGRPLSQGGAGAKDPLGTSGLAYSKAFMRDLAKEQGRDFEASSVTVPGMKEQEDLDRLFGVQAKAGTKPAKAAAAVPPASMLKWDQEPTEELDKLFGIAPQQAPQAQAPVSNAPAQPQPQITQEPVSRPMEWDTEHALANGAMLGFGPEIGGAIQAAKEVGGQALAQGSLAPLKDFSFYQQQAQRQYQLAREEAARGEHGLRNLVAESVGSLPATMAGMGGIAAGAARGAGLVGEVAPYLNPLLARVGAIAAPANGLPGVASGAIRGAIEGTEAGLLTSKLGEGPTPQSLGLSAVLGAATAPIGHLAAKVAEAAAQLPALRALADNVRQLGVNLRLGQISSEPEIRALDQHLVSPSHNTQQLRDYTRALSHTIGEDSEFLTASHIDAAKQRIGQEIGNLAQGMTITVRNADLAALNNIETEMRQMADPQAQAIVRRVVEQLQDEFLFSNTIPGKRFQDFIRNHGIVNQLETNADPTVKHFGHELRQMLFNAMEHTVPAPLVSAFREARRQYRNALVLEPLADKAPSGVINPKLVLTRARSKGIYPDTDLGQLAQAGQYLEAPTAQGVARGDAGGEALKKMGIVGGLGVLAHEFGEPIMHHAREHPLLAASLGALAGGEVAKRAIGPHMMASPLVNRLAIDGGLGTYLPNFNPLIPVANAPMTGVGSK